ncbi:hypothetical protein GCM10009627_18720 [Curtobacterium herbarum]|uniref:Uncharacterized protein n=1 Tax=Curtobacterium herbarum TaxID=150122 RepID=A0ABN1ZD23_9MICO
MRADVLWAFAPAAPPHLWGDEGLLYAAPTPDHQPTTHPGRVAHCNSPRPLPSPTASDRLWALGSGLWALGSGLWALGSGLWALGSGLWALGSGLWALGSGPIIPLSPTEWNHISFHPPRWCGAHMFASASRTFWTATRVGIR